MSARSEPPAQSAGSVEADDGRWPLERILFALAGTVILTTVALGTFASPWFLLLTALVGVSQWLFAAFGACPASLVLVHVFGVRRGRWGVFSCRTRQPSPSDPPSSPVRQPSRL